MSRLIVLAMTVLLCLTGCSAAREEESTAASPREKREQVTLWVGYEMKAQREALNRMVEEFNNSQDQYEVIWEYHGPMSEFGDQLVNGLVNRQLPDLVIMDSIHMRTCMEREMFADITSYVKNTGGRDDYYEGAMESVMQDGKYFGIPFSCYRQALFYNRSMFVEAGVFPTGNWEEFVHSAKLFTDEECFGFGFSALNEEEVVALMLPWMWPGEEVGTAYEMLGELVEDMSVSEECINWSVNDVSRKFQAGECAMMINGPTMIQELKNMEYGILSIPAKRGGSFVMRGENIGVIQGKNIKGAVAFIDFYEQEKVMGEDRRLIFGFPPKKTYAESMLEKYPECRPFLEDMDKYIPKNEIKPWSVFTEKLLRETIEIITRNSADKPGEDSVKQQP